MLNTEAGLLNKSSRLAANLGVTKFITMIGTNLVTLCCAAQVHLGCSTSSPLTPSKELLAVTLCFGTCNLTLLFYIIHYETKDYISCPQCTNE